MNNMSFAGFFKRLQYKVRLHARLLDTNRDSNSFAAPGVDDTIQRIYVINLDRKPDRWHQISRELGRFHDRSSVPLTSITHRFSAVDARYLKDKPDATKLRPQYSLADQLQVEPNPRLCGDVESRRRCIVMTPQEIAIALSHMEIWKLIAECDVPYTLILEDDVYFPRGFARSLDAAWRTVISRTSEVGIFDLLYLSFSEVRFYQKTEKRQKGLVRRPRTGIWQASGYVLSREGALRLLELLPAHGPIDLWLNLKFDELNVLSTQYPIIEQRIDVPSTNSYSVLPVLSQVGALTREKPLVVRARKLTGPVFAYGEPGSGLTALATALSMLGYTCCSDLRELPAREQNNLLRKSQKRVFNAYVNIGSLRDHSFTAIATLYPHARFIATTSADGQSDVNYPKRTLVLAEDDKDKWAALSTFLKLEYPVFPYPNCGDIGQREVSELGHENVANLTNQLKFDTSPWIASTKGWQGMSIPQASQDIGPMTNKIQEWSCGVNLDPISWKLRNDTFPSNLALFVPSNFEADSSEAARLTLRKEMTPVRSFTSGAIASRQTFLYGTFMAELRPSNVSGVITGIFLHRNGPRQEIDIEFLGKDTTKMLVNVYYNPGIEGTKLEYGYRGTPVLIDLGFDAAEEFHRYEIEWYPHSIRWRVDRQLVHERVLWNPTPIPNLPMEFNVNLWHSRSKELAGKLNSTALPAQTELKLIRICCY